jgi:hypothetical protein
MKRLFLFILAAGILGSGTLYAQPAGGSRIGVLVNLGFMTREALYIQWLTIGPEIVIPLGTRLSINPEVAIWGTNFGYRTYYVVPGALINLRVGRLSVGAGVVRRFMISGPARGDTSESVALKLQLGYRSGPSRIAVMVIPFTDPNFVSFGLAFGIGF